MKFSYQFLKSLSNIYGESFYILCSKVFLRNYEKFLNAFRNEYPKTIIAYSYKTNYIPYLCSLMNKNGGFAEVVSEMEYNLARKIGVPPDKIIVNGPYKPRNILIKYLLNGSIVNLDSFYEVELLEKIASEYPDIFFKVGLRCNFEISFNFVSRFGFDVNGNDFKKALFKISNLDNVKIVGLHCHFPNRDIKTFQIRTDQMLKLSTELFKTPPKYIDIGGGFWGILDPGLQKQFGVEAIPSFDDYAKVIAGTFKKHYEKYKKEEKPTLFIEPGTALVADAMYFVAKIIDIKEVRKKNIAISSGSKLNLGQLSLKINLPITVVHDNKGNIRKKYSGLDISGYTCIEGDYLYKNYNGSLERGDFIIFSNVGSYSIVFKPPFILPNVPIIDIDSTGEIPSVIKRQETLEDILSTYLL